MYRADINFEMMAIMIAWLGMIVMVSRQTIRSYSGTVGLPMAFLFCTTFLYCGAFIYIVPGYSHFSTNNLYLISYDFDKRTVLLGSIATLIGIAGFTVGNWLGGKGSQRHIFIPNHLAIDTKYRESLLFVLAALGIFGFILNYIPVSFPMKQVIGQVGRNLAVVVICLGAAMIILVDGKRRYLKWALWAGVIPVVYLVVWGFVSYGFIVFTIFAGFWLAVLKNKRLSSLKIGISATVITYGLLSAFVAYMSFRTELREVIWGGADFSTRISGIIDAFSNTKLLNPFDYESLDWLNTRLNQYIFVGKAIEYHELFPHLRMYGETLIYVLVSWVPRVFWPGKPRMGGSGLVADHTGMQFSESATFGAGPVFEFFVNFGYIGIFIGFIALGYLIRKIDKNAAIALRQGKFLNFARLFTVGIAFIAPLTDIFFMVSTAVSSWLVISALGPVIRLLAGREPRPANSIPAPSHVTPNLHNREY